VIAVSRMQLAWLAWHDARWKFRYYIQEVWGESKGRIEGANRIRVYTNETRLRGLGVWGGSGLGQRFGANGRGEWNSRLHKRNPPSRVRGLGGRGLGRIEGANGIRVYTNETRLRGLGVWVAEVWGESKGEWKGRMEGANGRGEWKGRMEFASTQTKPAFAG